MSLTIYLLISYLFMFGYVSNDLESENKSKFKAAIFILIFSPITFPYMLGCFTRNFYNN